MYLAAAHARLSVSGRSAHYTCFGWVLGRKGGRHESMMQASPPDTNGLNGIDSRYASKHIARVVDTHATLLGRTRSFEGASFSKLAEHASRNTTLQPIALLGSHTVCVTTEAQKKFMCNIPDDPAARANR